MIKQQDISPIMSEDFSVAISYFENRIISNDIILYDFMKKYFLEIIKLRYDQHKIPLEIIIKYCSYFHKIKKKLFKETKNEEINIEQIIKIIVTAEHIIHKKIVAYDKQYKNEYVNNLECKLKRMGIMKEKDHIKIRTYHKCNQCGNDNTITAAKMKSCSACKLVFYCNQKCQRKHWKLHKKKCNYKKNIDIK